MLGRTLSRARTAVAPVCAKLSPTSVVAVAGTPRCVVPSRGMSDTSFAKFPRLRAQQYGVSSSLCPGVEEGAFLVSHPHNAPRERSVAFVMRSNASEGVIIYKLPEVQVLKPMIDARMVCSPATLLQADFQCNGGTVETIPHDAVDDDVKSGVLLVVRHIDPWAIMIGHNEYGAWKAVLSSLGGRYAAMAQHDKPNVGVYQPHPLHDLLAE